MTQDAFSELLAIGTGPELNTDENETFVDAFLRQVERTPDVTAVVDEYSSITYGELDRRSDCLASVLIEKGIQVGDFVAVKLPRVKEFLVAVIGIWKAGAAYVPIDPAYPEERIKYMLEDSGAKLVIDQTWLGRLRETLAGEQPVSVCRAEAGGTALLMYTSGSTGAPKGVIISHTAISGMCISGNRFYQSWSKKCYKTADIVSFSYIYSCQNIYPSLTAGWELHLLPTSMAENIDELDRYLRSHSINIIKTIPQIAVTLMESCHTPMDIIGIGGSKTEIPYSGTTRVLVGYGLTETCGGVIYMMVSEKDNGKSIIGRPAAGTVVVLEDEDGAPVPFGEVGEICISSVCLAEGYLHDEEHTREVFVDRSWSQTKVFRTGDYCRWNEDKVLEFYGRKDDIVKIGSNRVSLAEVDASLSHIEEIKAATSALKIINGEPMLCGYYVSDKDIPETSLRSSLAEFLPSYMIPSLFVRLVTIPHLPNGKLDRLSLPTPETTALVNITAPATEFEKQVFKIVSDGIGIKNFGVTTNLLSLGLTSLRAIHLSVTLRRQLGLYIPQSVILNHPTIREWESISADGSDSIAVEAPREHYPLAENQMEIYIEWKQDWQSDQYNNPFLLKIKGGDAEKLLDSVRKTIENHPVLKTHLSERDGRIVQLRRDDAVLNVGFEELDFEPDEVFFKKLIHPFNLLDDDLARFSVYSSPDAVWLFFDIHHIIFDGSSVNLYFKTLSSLYRGILPEEEAVTAYDYALYSTHWKETDEFLECGRYFGTLLEGTESFTHRSLSCGKAEEGLGTEILTLPREVLKSFCRKCQITENAFFATVLTQLFHRFSREENIQIAMFSSGRSMTQLAGTIGMFVQTLPLVSRTAEGTVFDALKSIHSQIVETLSRDKYPYTILAEKYGVKPNVMYVYQGDLIEEHDFGSVSVEYKRLPVSCAIDPLSVEVVPKKDEYSVRFQYKSSVYGAEEVKTLAKAFADLARKMSTSQAGTLLCDIEMVDDQERQELLRIGTGKRLDYDHTETFVDLFLRSVAKHPDATAVVDSRSSLTYRELDEHSNAIAHRLIGEGVKPDEFVVVKLPRIKEFVAAVIGIWKAGAAYVPIDPAYPKERRRYMMEDSCAKVVIDGTFCERTTTRNCRPVNLSTPDGLAYMIYTSGSTGKPKGVMIQHLALTCFINFTRCEWHLGPDSHISCHSNYAFDSSVEDLYPVLTVGGTLFLPSEETCMELDELVRYLKANKITGGCYTTQIGQLLAASYPDIPLDYLTLGGEKMTLCPKCSYHLINSYGPTEVTVNSTYLVIDHEKDYTNIPIGRPLNNLQAFVCDQNAHFVSKGMCGELCMAGPQLAKGYWHNPELTAQKFVDCPYLPGQRMYKTGDLARWNENGELEYLGRIDDQVKIRGFRVELGEIERNAMQVEGTRQVAVKAKGDCIALYWCGESPESDIRSHLSEQLPAYMQPSAYIHLDAMPLTPSGKIDRRRLPEPEIPVGDTVAPRNRQEQELTDMIRETAALGDFGVTTNLISIGMSSISAMRIAVKVSRRYGVEVRMTEFMSNPTVEGLTSMINTSTCKEAHFGKVHPVQEYYPLTENQRLVYLSCLRNKDTIQYNMPSARYIQIEDVARIRDALIAVINAHPHLKTHLVVKDGDVMQQRRDECAVNITVVDTDSELSHEYIQSRIRPFNLEGDLYRIEIHSTSRDPQRACVIVDIHHIISDGLSMQIFSRDLDVVMAGQTLDPEKYSAYDYAIDLQESVNSTEYQTAEKWFDSLISGKEVTVYPHSYEGLKEPSLASLVSEVDSSVIDDYCRKHGFTRSNYFLTAFLYLLYEVTREDELLITTISNGRHSSSMMDAIGMFVTTLPVTAGVSLWAESVRNAIGTVQRQLFRTQSHDFYPFTQMAERHGIHAEVMYEYQGGITDTFDDDGDFSPDVAKLPLILSVDHGGTDGKYRLLVRYDQSMYSEVDMERMLGMLSFIAGEMPSAQSMYSIGLLDDTGIREIISLSTGPRLDPDIDFTFVKAFRECASSHPDNLAVEDVNGTHSYAELDNSSDILAHALVDAGVEPDSFVALLLDRTWFFPLSVIAVHKAGAAYVPLDLEYPAERLKYMLEDSRPKVLLTTRKDFEHKRRNGLDAVKSEVLFIEEMDLAGKAKPVDMSYPSGNAVSIYTSGSTGRPKGVVISQAGLWNFIFGIRSIYGHTAEDRIACHRTFSFVSHLEDIFVILTVGGSLHIMPSNIRKDLDMVHDYLVGHRITGCGFIASVTMLLLKHYNLDLRYITGGGELFSEVVNTGSPQIIHSYGPSECTVHTSVFLLEKGKSYRRIPVGRPLPNNWMFVVSADGKLLPRGVAGELCFAGIQVAKGYLNNPGLTAEKFCDCPFVQKDNWNRPVRMYHTGDLVRWNEDGYLEHIGRIDNQLKLRGFRIEPGEVESAALKCAGVLSAVAVLKNDTLVLYYTADRDVEFHWDTLPDYMIPSVCVYLDSMPLTPSGKIDRRVLPEPEVSHSELVAPATEREQIVFDKIRELLGTESFGVTDDLTRFGMNSIRAMKLALGLPAEWCVKVSDVMGSKTIRGMLSGKHDIAWFHEDYDPSKKTVAVAHGLVGAIELSALEDELSERYNVLTIEHIYDTLLSRDKIDKLVSRDGYNEFIRLYIRRIREILPEDGVLSLLIGFSLGGSMAYDIACRWSNLTGQKPVVMMGDSHLILSQEEVETEQAPSPEQWRERIREIHGSYDAANGIEYRDELLRTIRGNKKTIQHYDGKVIMLRAVHGHKLNVDVKSKLKGGFMYEAARWIYWHLHIRDIILGRKASKTGIFEAGHKRQSKDNISAWKHYCPDMETIDIDSTHNGLFWDRTLIPRYMELIELDNS